MEVILERSDLMKSNQKILLHFFIDYFTTIWTCERLNTKFKAIINSVKNYMNKSGVANPF